MNEKIALCVAIGCATAFAATNYDLLGRNGSKMNSPMVYRNEDYSKMKKDNQQDVGVQRGNKALKKLSSRLYWIDGLEGIFSTSGLSYNGSLLPFYCETSQSNGVHIYGYYSDLAEYLEHPNFYFIPTNLVQNYTPSGIQTSGQATFTNYTLSEPYDASSYAPTTFWTVEFGNIMANRGSIGWWFDNGYGQCQECADVGMYMDIGAFPVRLEPNKTTSYIAYNQGEAMNPDPEREVIASKAYSLLSETTKNTTFFVSNGLPENPESKSPQVYIGLHNRKNDPNVLHEAATYYGEEARALDNYIYENRTVDIVAAGNYWIRNNDAQLNAQAHAANAITVGAIDSYTGRIADYTSNKSRYCEAGIGQCLNEAEPQAGSRKPEIYNYSEFYMDGDRKRTYTHWYTGQTYNASPNYDGTEAAATYTAAQVAALLRANPFYRWHPEVVKAVLLTSGVNNIATPYPHGENNVATTKIPTYYSVVFNRFHNNYFHESRYWTGYWPWMTTHIVGMKTELRFSIKRPTDKHNFSAAIAWLSSGDDIANFGRIPQNFDLYVYENNVADVNNINNNNIINNPKAKSTSESDAFEKVSFSSNAQYLTFRIVLKDEVQNSPNASQAVLGFDLAAAN
ncbi:S8 family serine peptidase [Fibrobacter succinogenes]|uniref:S8 family serine peptidase n=1 Tax=Fibrobacter succinogenes TaxID=833 RepID=UPI0015660E7B|nr:S8 family serine peptidase [Fibrobacter succinogenes]